MELIYVLDRRRLQRELRRREAALRKATEVPLAVEPESLVVLREAAEVPPAVEPESLVALREAAEVPPAAEPKPESPAAQSASKTRGWWECDFCGRGFHGYGQFLNHNCHEGD